MVRPAIIFLLLGAGVFAQQDLSPAESKKDFETVCTECHELDRITERRATHDVWNTVVNRMESEGATATRAQFKSIVEYLARNFPPKRLNVNEASAADLAAFFAVSDSDARSIVEYRVDKGTFKDLASLLKSGAARGPIEAKKDSIDY